MKLVIITGPHAVGKMTVGQELAKITDLKLLHNHMTIEFVSNFFDVFNSAEGKRLNTLFRREIIEAVAKSDLPGLIYTAMVAFDMPSNKDYLNSIVELFESRNAEIYVVELCADFNVRIERNKTENRLLNKPTKRNLQKSEEAFRKLESEHRFNSRDEEILFKNYLRIDNTNLPPKDVAAKIKDTFSLQMKGI